MSIHFYYCGLRIADCGLSSKKSEIKNPKSEIKIVATYYILLNINK